jgi:hypothetical protein
VTIMRGRRNVTFFARWLADRADLVLHSHHSDRDDAASGRAVAQIVQPHRRQPDLSNEALANSAADVGA